LRHGLGFRQHLHELLRGTNDARHAAVAYVGGMTDRFACRQAMMHLGWGLDRRPAGVGI